MKNNLYFLYLFKIKLNTIEIEIFLIKIHI
jgi:hypothetical protein